jgi:hypothetical protein
MEKENQAKDDIGGELQVALLDPLSCTVDHQIYLLLFRDQCPGLFGLMFISGGSSKCTSYNISQGS